MFQYISDIHLEYLTYIPYIKKTGNNLCLVGDIGHPGTYLFNTFLKKCSETYKNIFLVYGNHEYYSILRGKNKKIETMQQRIDYQKNFPLNVHFLNNSCVYFNKNTQEVKYKLDVNDNKSNYLKIIGSTLWSNKGRKANNFKNIFVEENQLLTFEYQSQLFLNSKYYILEELYKEEISTLLLTHYTTHKLCNGLYIDNKDTNHIPEFFHKDYLIAAINGHTHSSINTVVPGTAIKLVANCFGYKSENQKVVMYNENATISPDELTNISFCGIYSNSDINPIEILYKIMTRPNPKYNIGQVSEYTSFIITTTTKDNTILYVNRAFEQLTGYSLNDIQGKNCRFLQSPTGEIRRGVNRQYCDNNLLFNVKTDIFNNDEVQFITYNFMKNGTKFINLVTIIPITINSMNYFVGFQRNITNEIHKFSLDKISKTIMDQNIIDDLKNNNINNDLNDNKSITFSSIMSDTQTILSTDSHSTYRNKSIRYKHFFDDNPSLLCIIDLNGYLKKVNTAFLNAFGYTKLEMINKPIFEFIHHEYVIKSIQCFQNIQDVKHYTYQTKFIRKDKNIINLNLTLNLKGDIIYCVSNVIQ
jgi:PAS domain S-box-containing protein